MPPVYLPAEHTDADLVLAGTLAEVLGSAELHVAWTVQGGAGAPVVGVVMREPVNPVVEALAWIGRAVARAVTRLAGRRARRHATPQPAAPAGLIVTWTPPERRPAV
jgi:hypothetical protein